MALLKTTYVQTALGPIEVPQAYYKIDAPCHTELSMGLSFKVAAFKDKATRRTYDAALKAYLAKLASFSTAEKALKAAQPAASDTDKQKAEKIKAIGALAVARNQAQIDLSSAELVLNEIQQLPAVDVTVPLERVSDMLTNGTPDKKKLYPWLTTLDGWTDAVSDDDEA